MRSCNTPTNLSHKECNTNKIEGLNLSVFNIMAALYMLKIVTKHISCKCQCKFDGRKCNSNQKWINNKCWCECKNPKEYNTFEKDYIWNPVICSFKTVEYLENTIEDSVITCNKVINDAENQQMCQQMLRLPCQQILITEK